MPDEHMSLQRSIAMRYLGQWRSLSVPVDAELDLARRGGRRASTTSTSASSPTAATTRRSRSTSSGCGRSASPRSPSFAAQELTGRDRDAEPVATRPVKFDEFAGTVDTPIFDRERLGPATSLDGPGDHRPVRLDHRRAARGRADVDEWLNHPHAHRGAGVMSTEERGYSLDPVTFEVAQERVRDDGRPDGGADPAHLPLVRDLRARLLVGAVRPRRATRSCRAARTSPCTSARCTSPPRP